MLAEVRRICLALPEVTERLSHGSPTWFLRSKRTFVSLLTDGHHDADFPQLWPAPLPRQVRRSRRQSSLHLVTERGHRVRSMPAVRRRETSTSPPRPHSCDPP